MGILGPGSNLYICIHIRLYQVVFGQGPEPGPVREAVLTWLPGATPWFSLYTSAESA